MATEKSKILPKKKSPVKKAAKKTIPKKPAIKKIVKKKPVKKKAQAQVKKPVVKKPRPENAYTPFVVGNQFWKNRSKHGRDKLFADSIELWNAACEYFEFCDRNPLIEIDYKGKDATRVQMPKMRAYTIHGLCLYLNCNTKYFNDLRDLLKEKHKEQWTQEDTDLSDVITRIIEIIYTQKFEGAAAGFLNPNIIARDLGLADKTQSQQLDENGNAVNPTPKIMLNKQDAIDLIKELNEKG